MEFGYFAMPSHPPERGLKAGHDWDLQVLRWLDEMGYSEAWTGEHHSGKAPAKCSVSTPMNRSSEP